MFSRMRRNGDVADHHVAKFVMYFSKPQYDPTFTDEVAEKRNELLGGLAQQPQPATTDSDPEIPQFGDADRLYLYQVAFLWHGCAPPPVNMHWFLMTPDVEETKRMLHGSIAAGMLTATQVTMEVGLSSYVMTMEDLRSFAQAAGMRPKAFFPDAPSDPLEMLRNRAALIEKLTPAEPCELRIIEDWLEHDARDEWLVYEAAFLWHGFEPPSIADHFRTMTPEVEETKQMLHTAIDEGKLAARTQMQTPSAGSRYVTRSALTAFARTLEQRPRFLFPESMMKDGDE